MARKQKKAGFFKKLGDFLKFHPKTQDIYSFYAFLNDELHNPANYKQLTQYENLSKKERSRFGIIPVPLPSVFQFFMDWLNYILINGFLLWLVGSVLLLKMLPIYYILGLGLFQYLALDILMRFFWGPLKEVIKAFPRSRR